MRASTWLVALSAALTLTLLSAQVVTAETNTQQEKMKTCNADATAKSLKGDAREAFMKTCLSDHAAPAASTNSQQEKMKSCNAEATTKSLKGDARQAFMKTCLSGSAK